MALHGHESVLTSQLWISLELSDYLCYAEVLHWRPERRPPSFCNILGQKISGKGSFQVGIWWTCKRYRNKAGMRETLQHYPTTEQWRLPLWPPTLCTCIPSLLCYMSNKSELGMQVHCIGGQWARRPPLSHVRVVCSWEFLILLQVKFVLGKFSYFSISMKIF